MKRPLLHRLFSVWLALLVLASSVGLTVQQHTCRQSGQHTTAIIFSPARHGCPPTTAPNLPASSRNTKAQLTKSCCEFGAHFHKLDASTVDGTWAKAPLPPLALHWPVAFSWAALAVSTALPGTEKWHAGDTSPPLRAGRALLFFVCTLIV
ncbi:HYC_CC_PP family protein [Hymenobacter sp. AT01-02]|uniref:HYC_CC_PP family protein n=1 Tax=Hymenobacter sp. AT01-02 TaxID=1571877 RepID=UPI00128F61AF|nr:hypothetical protein [Hymenobacter sp. AT01-02]